MKLLLIAATAVCLSFGAGQIVAQDLHRGIHAFSTGDYKAAFVDLMPLALKGDSDAQWRIGWMYYTGDGVAEDVPEALKWFRLAAPHNVVIQMVLGQIYQHGEAGKRDHTLSLMWYTIASRNGWSPAEDLRDRVAAGLTNEEITKAETMAETCISGGYKDCGS
jgi:TPR repeat protein